MHPYLESIPLAPSLLGIAILVCFGIYIRSSTRTNAQVADSKNTYSTYPTTPAYNNGKTTENAQEPTSYPPINPLPNFNWEDTPPLAIRPFKPKYHLTMAISTLDPSELIPMDKTYKERLALRKTLLESHPDTVRAVNMSKDTPEVNARIREALCEWYAFIVGEYLPSRYPTMFRLAEGEEGVVLENIVTGARSWVDPDVVLRSFTSEVAEGDDVEEARLLHLMDILSSYIDEDFLILFPNPLSPSTTTTSPEEIPYTLQLYSTYYPAGFNPREKLGLPLAQIHTPVPGYKQKLEKSMDRFFARLEVGRFVVRANWSIMTPGARLFAAFGGLHDHSPEDLDLNGKNEKSEREVKEEIMDVEGFDGSDTYLRCERQTLHRLPKSKALVFAFHTYTYPIKDIRDEGLGEEMAVAIDGLKEGNVPGIHAYKRGAYWGEAVKKFLRS
ncbi:hypothetical protein BJX68DRAFT_89361 [Aspergillus pseudodeflectus]|uniref:HRQ family protein 2 n=1 Tax=Aspergillus pseudodeflectus TaxID=176178 RepID=A0ABR4L7V6_9EURO